METKSLTYRKLLAALKVLTDEELDLTVSVFVSDEFKEIDGLDRASKTDILDKDHPFLLIKE